MPSIVGGIIMAVWVLALEAAAVATYGGFPW